MPITSRSFITGLGILLTTAHSFGQVEIQIGSGTILNSPFASPSPYANVQPGSRNQFLFLASELQGMGLTAGTISSVGFDVVQTSFTSFSGFTIGMGHTDAASLTTTWETGIATVWGPMEYTDVEGWTSHQFTVPFEWDGISNIVLETCYANFGTAQNAQVRQTATSFTSCVARNSPNAAICSDPGGTHIPFQQRPNVRFFWTPLEAPPVAMPSATPLFTCSGTVQFMDHSLNQPTTWSWDLGDGESSTEETFEHTYTASGSYEVVLTVTNDFGEDAASITVVVDLSGATPQTGCAAPSSGDVEGIGILSVIIEDFTFDSGDAVSEGYLDNTCQTIDVLQGTELDLSVTTGSIPSHAVRAWLDRNNSGTFTPDELLLTGSGPTVNSATLVPNDAILNVPLRLRVVAAYDLLTPDPAACGTVEYGQAEDYSVRVLANTLAPETQFSASPSFSCDGTVRFTDASFNTPTAWAWDFGDSGTSNEQNPEHTYAESGTYTVTLTAINAIGEDELVRADLVTVDLEGQLIAASCTPNTTSYCCGYGILGFNFAGINSTSGNGNEGYQDRSCGNTAMIQSGEGYAWSVTTGDETPHDTRIWIDLNNDGAFTSAELVATALDQSSPSGLLLCPAATVYGVPVRVRVQSDVIGHSVDPCDEPLYGQVEDFSAILSPSTDPPVAAFSAMPLITCDGVVQFTDASANIPTSWSWQFGDGGTSNEQNPQYTYDDPGIYTVTLTATNEYGSDGQSLFNYIRRVETWQCDTLNVGLTTPQTNTACYGVLADDGGPNGNYSTQNSETFTISPTGAEVVHLQFSQFQWGNNPNRRLVIYDGPDTFSQELGAYTGNGLFQLPDGGSIVSSGPSITLRQETEGPGGPPMTGPGFLLTWSCSFTGIAERRTSPVTAIHPIPADDHFILDLTPSPSQQRRIVLRNAIGQVQQEHVFAGANVSHRIDCTSLAPGLYAVQVLEGSSQWSHTLIIH